MEQLVYALFWDEAQVRRAIEEFDEEHFSHDEICILLKNEGEDGELERVEVSEKTATGRGVVIGAALGAIGGALVVPFAGWMAAGPLLAALSGATFGAGTGGGLGALAGLGIWKEDVDVPEEELREGAILVGVQTSARVDRARAALKRAGATEVQVTTCDDVRVDATSG